MSPGGEGLAEQIAELTQQLAAQGGMIGEMADHVRALETKNVTIEAELGQARDALRAALADASRSDKRPAVRKLYPEKWQPAKESFKDWAEEFLRWVRAEDEELEEYLRSHQSQREPLPMPMGSRKDDVKFVHSHLRRLVAADAESKRIVKTTIGDHGGESWRRLMRKHNPQTLAAKNRRLREITNFGLRHANVPLSSFVSTIAEYEELIDKFVTDYGEQPALESQKRDSLKLVLPKEVEKAFNLNSLGRNDAQELDYEGLRATVEAFIEEWEAYDKPVHRRSTVG